MSSPRLICEGKPCDLLLKTCPEVSACQYHVSHCSFTSPMGMGAEGVGLAEKGSICWDILVLENDAA